MKKKYFIALLLLSFGLFNVSKVNAQKQKHTDRYYNSWRLGLNAGGMWQTSDVRRNGAGFAGGFTLEKGFFENKTHFFSLAIRGRGLWGNTYGLDYSRNYNVYNDPALNGKYNPRVNYDSVAANGGAPYIYNNFKTKIAEGSLELQICFNQLRERTNILLNLWGGIGFTSYRTKINVLNNKDQMYNYLQVDSSGSSALALSSHKFLLDNTYESYGNNSQNGNVLTWSPSCGIGFGYRFNDHISLLWEYKLTFPQGAYADYLDGIEKHNNDWLGCNKDYYHYTGVNLLIKLGKGKGGSSHTNLDNYNNATTNTVVTTNPTTGIVTNPTQTVIANEPIVQKPIVNITNPPYSPYNETVNKTFTINATVQHVNHRSEVYITFNGNVVTNYTWLGRFISFVEPLNVGDNVVTVAATNSAGSDSKSAVINYSGVPPQITITTPGAEKFTSAQSNADIFATILNVEGPQSISVNFNGQLFNLWSYDINTKQFSMNTALITGTNAVDISAINIFGRDEKVQLIIYNPIAVVTATGTASKSVNVTITDPTVNPYKSTSAIYKVKAKVTGVNSQSQVTVTANSNQIPFTYLSGNVTMDVPLSSGNAFVQVSASNGKMSDSKSVMLTYNAPSKTTPPTVVIINPNPSPKTTTDNTYPFRAQTTYITDKSQLEVKYNGNITTEYTFDSNTGFIDYNANLNLNSNDVFEVKATNSYGSASASAIVKQEQPKTKVICHHGPRGKSETMTINESEWPVHQAHGDSEGPCQMAGDDPAITICHNNGDGSKQTMTILQSQWIQHQAHGDVMGACPKIIVETPDNDITICHNNGDGSKQTIVIKQSAWAMHQAHGDVMGACPKIVVETPDNNITICHNNGDGSKQTILIKQSAWPMHQAHGDVMGACPKIVVETPDNDITICHNNGDGTKQTIIIKESTWPMHQAHGDVKGTCPKLTGSQDLDPDMIICHKNADGSLVKMTIKTSQWPSHQAHGDFIGGNCTSNTNTTTPTNTVEICHNNGDGTKQTIIITVDQFPVHRAHGDVMGKCPALTNTVTADPPMTICHNNGDGSTTTMTIVTSQWPTHRAHGDGLGVCVTTTTVEPGGNKIQICHIPPGNHQNPQTIEIPESAWPAHEAHGDAKVPCAPNEKKITICHIPPGNPNNPQTIEIAESAWPAHAAHGDVKGECPSQQNIQAPGPGKGRVLEGDGGNNGGNNNGSNPGRTMQKPAETTSEPQKATTEPQKNEIKLRPR